MKLANTIILILIFGAAMINYFIERKNNREYIAGRAIWGTVAVGCLMAVITPNGFWFFVLNSGYLLLAIKEMYDKGKRN